jgi:hypothetical protein
VHPIKIGIGKNGDDTDLGPDITIEDAEKSYLHQPIMKSPIVGFPNKVKGECPTKDALSMSDVDKLPERILQETLR